MPLESALYVGALDATNPAAGDSLSQTDDHLRLIKATLKNSFPNVTGAATATHTQLSDVATKTGTETFTNKTLTAPTMNGGTLSGVTLSGSTTLPGSGRSIDASGNFAIVGLTTSAAATFGGLMTANAGGTITGGQLSIDYDTAVPVVINRATAANALASIQFKGAGTAYGHIGANSSNSFTVTNAGNTTTLLQIGTTGNLTATGNVTAFSDRKLKTEIVTIPDGLNLVTRLRGVYYTRKDTGDHRVGLIAQEVQKVVPDAVIDVDGTLAVSYGDLVGVLIEAIKELKAEVDYIKTRVGV